MNYTSYVANSWIHKASDKDIETLYLNNLSCFREFDMINKTVDNMKNSFYRANPNTQLYLGMDGDNIVSNLFFTYSEDRKICHIDTLCIGDKYRKGGYGTQLLWNFFSRGEDVDYYTLDVLKDNIPAQKLYKKYGFKTAFFSDLDYTSVRLVARGGKLTPLNTIQSNKLDMILGFLPESTGKEFNYNIRFSSNLINNINNIDRTIGLTTDDFRCYDECQRNSGIADSCYMRVNIDTVSKYSRAYITIPTQNPFQYFLDDIKLLFVCVVYEDNIIVIYYNPKNIDNRSYKNVLEDCKYLDNALIANEFNEMTIQKINTTNLPFRVNYCDNIILNSPCDCFIKVYSKTLFYTPVLNIPDLDIIKRVTGTNSDCYEGVLRFIKGVLDLRVERGDWIPEDGRHNIDGVEEFALADFQHTNDHVKSLLGDKSEIPFTYVFIDIVTYDGNQNYISKENRVVIEDNKYINTLNYWMNDEDISIIIIPLKLLSSIDYYNVPDNYPIYLDKYENKYLLDNDKNIQYVNTVSHANTIIINKNKHTVEFYEPHGSYGRVFNDIDTHDTEIYTNIESFLKRNIVNLNSFKFKKIQETCPNLGLQAFDIEKIEQHEISGYCIYWTLLRIDLSVTFPECKSIVFDNIILNYLQSSMSVRDFIRNYAFRIVQSLWKYHYNFMKIKRL